MKITSKGLERLSRAAPERTYQAWASPLYRWIDTHCETIQGLRKKGRSWDALLQAAIEDGIEATNDAATRKKCRGMFTRIQASRRKKAAAVTPSLINKNPGITPPSRVSPDWRPSAVEKAYGTAKAENDMPQKKAHLVADQDATLPLEPKEPTEAPEERAARLTEDFEKQLFADHRATGPGFSME